MTQTGLRMPEELSEKLDEKAKAVGISKNALLLVLVYWGFRLFESANPQGQQEQIHEATRIPQRISEQHIQAAR